MFELNKCSEKSADSFRGQVEKMQDKQAEVKARNNNWIQEPRRDYITKRHSYATVKRQFNPSEVEQNEINRMKNADNYY